MIGIPVYDQRRNSVRLPVNQPVGIRLLNDCFPVAEGAEDALFPELGVDGFSAAGDDAKGNLGMVAIKTLARNFPFCVSRETTLPGAASLIFSRSVL